MKFQGLEHFLPTVGKGSFNREGTQGTQKKRNSGIPLKGGVPERRGGFFQGLEKGEKEIEWAGRCRVCPQITQITQMEDGQGQVIPRRGAEFAE